VVVSERLIGVVVGKDRLVGGGELGRSLVSVGSCLTGEEEVAGRLVSVSVFAFSGVLKGDLNGWESVWDALSIRRRLEGRIGDMMTVVAQRSIGWLFFFWWTSPTIEIGIWSFIVRM